MPGVAAAPVTPLPASRDRTPLPVAGHAAMAPVPPVQVQMMTPPAGSLYGQQQPVQPAPYPIGPAGQPGTYPQPAHLPPAPRRSNTRFLWWVIALLAIGASAGTAAGLLLSK
jgi:hypothetical protein